MKWEPTTRRAISLAGQSVDPESAFASCFHGSVPGLEEKQPEAEEKLAAVVG